MTFDERFPKNEHSSWQAVGHGYRPNHYVAAQTCEECGALVEYAARALHSARHDRLSAVERLARRLARRGRS